MYKRHRAICRCQPKLKDLGRSTARMWGRHTKTHGFHRLPYASTPILYVLLIMVSGGNPYAFRIISSIILFANHSNRCMGAWATGYAGVFWSPRSFLLGALIAIISLLFAGRKTQMWHHIPMFQESSRDIVNSLDSSSRHSGISLTPCEKQIVSSGSPRLVFQTDKKQIRFFISMVPPQCLFNLESEPWKHSSRGKTLMQ